MNRSSFIRQAIIDAYSQIKEDKRMNPIRAVAVSLGYTINRNGTNTFVAAVIKEYERIA